MSTEDEPTLGFAQHVRHAISQITDPPSGRPVALYGLTAGSLFFNFVFAVNFALSGGDDSAAVATEAPVTEDMAAAAAVPDPSAPAAAVEIPADMQVVRAPINQSLARTFQDAAPEGHGDVLSAVTARLFAFNLNLRTELQKGDDLRVAYVWDGPKTRVVAATYDSSKQGRKLAAYEYKVSGDQFTSWWDAEGNEVALRLVDSPIADYEQITSLLKDRPKHRGMDFKAPEGVPVTSPRAGVVTRVNWNWANNGNCVEVRYADGTVAKFLHLSRSDAKEGQKLAKGDAIGLVGNTGHSTAAHLHYELDKGGTTVDPIDYHGTIRRTMPAGDLGGFSAERDRLDAILQGN